jgi:hypothetical protein
MRSWGGCRSNKQRGLAHHKNDNYTLQKVAAILARSRLFCRRERGRTGGDVICDVDVKTVDMAVDRGGWDEGCGREGGPTIGKAIVKPVVKSVGG